MTGAAAAPSLPGTAQVTRIEVRLSTLWIFAMFNSLYANVLTLIVWTAPKTAALWSASLHGGHTAFGEASGARPHVRRSQPGA